MAKYDKYNEGVKATDNFIRTFNRQLTKAYTTGGEDSRTYKNLLSTARTYFTDSQTGETSLKVGSKGQLQISRSIKNLETYTKRNIIKQLEGVMYRTNKYGQPIRKKGKKELKSFYSAKTSYDKAKRKLMQKGIKRPAKKDIMKQIQYDDKIDTLFAKYKAFESGVIDSNDYEFWSNLGNRVHNETLTEKQIDNYIKQATEREKNLTKKNTSDIIKAFNDAPKY